MKIVPFRRRWIAAAIVMLLLLFLFRPGASRLKSKIISSMSYSLGRSVDIGTVRIRLLPRPGFDLENLTVYDDLAFGAEPMLRAGEVTASLRVTSLLRGRIEIARLNLTEPSLNLVRGEDGYWNLETLLERAAHTPLAPTGKAKSEPRPGFPYIEASSARINFKSGQEKKPYALSNADFSLWQDSENTWGVRLKAQPIRTDLNLNDTGILRVNGTWQRAASLRDTPLDFALELDRAQIGQLSKFVSGRDQGWRGGVLFDASLRGSPANLQVSVDTSIDDFRRYDITTGDAMRLAAHCDARYSSVDRMFRDLLCNAPVRGGYIALKGSTGLPASHNYNLLLSAQDVPADALADLARRAKKNLPQDLTAAGILGGSVTLRQNGPASMVQVQGRGEIAALQLTSASAQSGIGPETVPFIWTTSQLSRGVAFQRSGNKTGSPVLLPSGPHLELGPVPLSAGHATLRAWIDRSGYDFSIAGDGDLAKLLASARMFGIPAIPARIEGDAQLDLQIAGAWASWMKESTQSFVGPLVTGTARLRNARIALRGVASPVDIASAELYLLPDRTRLDKLNARAANTSWSGSLELPRGCGTPAACQAHFVLGTNQVSLDDLSAWINPRPKDSPWYRVLQPNSPVPAFLSAVRASGHVTAERAQIEKLAATHLSANLAIDTGMLKIADLTANVLGGRYRGEWLSDFTAKPPTITGRGSLSGISVEEIAATMNDPWISGTANGSFQITGAGSTASTFWPSAEGTLQFDVSGGELAHISLEDEGPLRVMHFSGSTKLRLGKFEVQDARLESPAGDFQLSGSVTLAREMDLKLVDRANSRTGYAISGTLSVPHVQPVSGNEQARLKH